MSLVKWYFCLKNYEYFNMLKFFSILQRIFDSSLSLYFSKFHLLNIQQYGQIFSEVEAI